MKKKQLVAVFVMMLAAATMATACQPTEAKAKDALKYLDEKYSDEQVITLDWSAGSDYDALTYDFLENFKVNNGFEMEVYADEALTDLQDQNALELEEGNNDFWIVVFKAGKSKDDKSAHVFKVNIHKPVTVDVTTVVNGVRTVVASVEENSLVEVPAAPVLTTQESFLGWYRDEAFMIPFDQASVESADFELYAKIGEATWTAEMKVKLENVDDDGYTLVDGTIDQDFVGVADKSEVTYTMPGFTLDKIEANGDDVTAYYKRNTFTVTLLGADESTPYATIENVKYGAVPDLSTYAITKPDDGETVYTFNKWVTLTDGEVGAVTGTVSYKPVFTSSLRTYTITEEIEGATIEITSASVENYYKSDSVSFRIVLDADYNRSADYTILVNGTAVDAVEGVYTATFPGLENLVVTAEGIEQNTYVANLSATVVNTGAEFAKIKNAEDVVLYVDGEEVDYDDLSAIAIDLKSGAHKIELKVGEEVHYTREFTIEAGQADIDLDSAMIGYFNFEGGNGAFYQTADGLVNSIAGQEEFIGQQAYFADIDPTADAFKVSANIQNNWDALPEGKTQETDPGYAFEITGGGAMLEVIFMNSQVRIIYSGMSGWAPLSLGKAYDVDVKAETDGDGLKLGVMKKGNAYYFYAEDRLQFAFTEDGVTCVAVPLSVADNVNATIAERIAAILAADDVQVGLYFTMNGANGQYLPVKVTDASYTDDAEELAKFNEYGAINFAVDTSSGINAPAKVNVSVGKNSIISGKLINKGDVSVDLNDYFLINQTVAIQIGDFNNMADLGKLVVYTSTDGGVSWDEGTDVTEETLYATATYWQYNLTPEKGKTYKFEVTHSEFKPKTDVQFLIKSEDTFVSDVEYSIYRTANDTLVATSKTLTIDGLYNGEASLPAGEYYIEIATAGSTFGKRVEFTVPEESDEAMSIDVELTKNIWGTNFTGVGLGTATFSADITADNVASTFTLTREGYCGGSGGEWILDQGLNNGEMISFSLKFNEGNALFRGPNGSYDGEPTFKNTAGVTSDMYIKFYTTKADGTYQNHGIGSSGAAWGGTTFNASPFLAKGIEAQYVKENPDLSLVYDFGYAKLNNVVYLFVKYHDVDEWTLVSSNATGEAATQIKLGIASRGEFNLNYTLNNFAYLQDADAVQTLYDLNLVTDGPMTGTNGEKTINGDGVVSDKTAGTLAYSCDGDAVIWDTDTIGDVNKGKMTIEGDYSVFGSRHQGGGFVIKQMATGKFMTIMMDYSASSLILSLSAGNGWALRQYLHNWTEYKKGFADAQNNLTWGNTTKDAPLTYYMKAELEGYNLKIWVAKSKATVETNPNFVMNIYEAYKNGNGGGGSAAGFGDAELAVFPFLADVDGHKAQSSKAYESGVVALGYAFCGDNTRGGAISNGSINYFTYDDILNAAKAEAEEAIKAYAQEIEYTLEEGDLDPIGAMTAPSQKAEVIEAIKASITEKDAAIDLANAKADALTMLDEYAATKVYVGTEEAVVVEDVMKEKITSATNLDEVAAGLTEAKALVDYFAEKGKEVAETLLTKVSAGLASVDAEVAKATEMTDYGKAELDAVVAKAKADINAISTVDDIDNVIASYVKTVTDSVAKVCAKVAVTFAGNEAMDVLYGTKLADIAGDAVIPEKADDKDGLGQYVGQWIIEGDALATEDVAVNVSYVYEYYNVTIAGTAVDYAGSAISGVTVTVNHVAGMTFTGVTDAEGKFSINAKLGGATITWSTPELADGCRLNNPDANYVIARTGGASTVAEDKDTTKTINVALAYGISVGNVPNATVEKTGEYASDDLTDATYEGYSVSAYGFQSNIHLRTGNVLKENTYFKFRVNLNGAEGEKLAHNVHKSGIYYSGDANKPFGDIALKMIVGGYAAKINGQGGEVVNCDQWQADFVAGQLFTRTGAQPFAGLYENATRGGGPLTALKPDYDKVDMDLMYVKTTDNQVTLYGKLAISDNDWIALATATVKGDWMTLGNASRNSDWYQNFTYENIEYGAIDTETGLPEGEAKQDYNYVGANASAYTDAEGKEHFELNLSGYGNGGNASHYENANSGGNGSFAVIYDKTKEYDYQNGRLELEADFTPTSAGGNGAGVGFMLYDADSDDANPFNADQRMFSILIRANGNAESKDCLMLQLRAGNGSGARIWGTGGAIDRSQYASFSEGFKLPPVWTNGAEPTFKLKYVFDNNTLTTYIDGVEFFKITDVANFIKTELDGDTDVTEFNNRYPDGPVHAALFFNHERAYGTDRARVENFKVSYMTNAEALEAEKADAKKAVTDAATEYGVEANAEVLAQIDAVTERGKAAPIATAEIAKMKFAYDLANEKKAALDSLNAYAVELNVEGEIPASITALITDVTELGKAQDALVEAKGLLEIYANSPDCWDIIVASTKTLEEKYAAVDQSTLTAKGIEDLNSAYATAKSTINALDDKDTAQSSANGAIAAFEEIIAKVQGTVAVTFGSNDAIDVKYGTLLSAVDASALTDTKAEDTYYTYEFKGWKVNDDAVVADVAVEAEFTAINKVVEVSGKAVDERGNALAGVTVSAVIDVDGKEATASTTTAQDGTYTFNVAVGDKTDLTFAKNFYFSKATSYEGVKTEAQTIANAVMPWTWSNDNANNAKPGVVTIKGETPTTALDSTVDTATLDYNYVGAGDQMSRLSTNLADGEAIQLSFRWNDGQEADQDPYMRMAYGSAAYHINSFGTGFGGMTGVNGRTFDIALGRDLIYGAFTGKVYDFAFVREGQSLKMFGKHGGAMNWKEVANTTIAADNTDTTFKFGFGTKYSVAYNYSIFNASKVAPSVITGNTAAEIHGSHGSVDKNADGSWSLWGSLSNIGSNVSACTLTTGAYDQNKYDMTGKRVVIDTDFSMGSGENNDNLGLRFASADGGEFMLGFFRNGLAMQLSGGNGWGQRHWTLTSASTGVLYWNDSAMFKLGDLNKNGNYRQASAHLTYELQDRVLAMYVDGTLAFACDYVQVMGNYTGGENGNANTVEKAEAKAPKYTNVQFGFFGNHERTGHALDFAAENFKVTLVDPAAENALADAKAKTIAKINAIVVDELSPAGKEYYEANKAAAIEAIEAYEAVEGDNLTKSIIAIEKIAAPVLVTNRDYTVHITGYGKVTAKWGTTLASLVDGKEAKTASNAFAAYYNTDGKWNIAEGATVSIDNTVINPTGTVVQNGSTVGISNNNGGYFYGVGNYGILIPSEMCDVNAGTMTITATVKYWISGTDASKLPEAVGFGLTQVSTGKTVRISNNRDGGVWMSTGANVGANINGWGRRIFPSQSGLPNWKATAAAATARDKAGTLQMKMEVSGATWKFWVSTGSFSANPNVTVNAQEFYYTAAQTATGSASASAKTDGCNDLPDLKTDGLVIPNVVVFGDDKPAWEIQNVKVEYVAK